MSSNERIVIVGGPRTGKSWLARTYKRRGCRVFCGDPLSKVKDPEDSTTYLPEGLAMEDESTRFIAQNWFTMPAPWVCEGWIMARALRKWIQLNENGELDPGDSPDGWPCSRIIVLEQQRPEIELLPGQARMHKGIMQTTWPQIRGYFEGMYETRRWDAD